jgi:glutamate-1-semialdehyde 2,1-aminomutase
MAYERSKALYQEAKTLMPGGVSSPVRAFRGVGGDPLFISRVEGSRVYDADDRGYIDYVGSWGPAILGHAHPKVVKAVQEQAAKGLTFGAPSHLEIELAKRVKVAYPSIDRVRFVVSGTEATMSAARLARAATKRNGIAKIDGNYHGHADFYLVAAGSGATTLGTPDSAGVPEGIIKYTYSLPFNDVDALERLFAKSGSEIAALILEPVAGNMGLVLPKPGYLEACREITKRYGALLIFDEVMTGFRVAYGGAQERYKITPDLTTLGKVVGGGMPVAAYGGRDDLMKLVAPEGPMYQAGTLSGNPLGMVAGALTLDLLKEPGVYDALEAKGKALAAGLAEAAKESNIPAQVASAGSMVGIFFSDEEVFDYASAKKSDTKRFGRFFWSMMEQGVYLAPSQFEAWFVSLAHSDEDIKATISAAKAALRKE